MQDKPDGAVRLFARLEEILTVLKVAKLHVWPFSFGLTEKGGESSFSTELLRVDGTGKTLVFGPEVNHLCGKKARSLRFRAQSGGIKICFDTRNIPDPEKPLSAPMANYCKVEFPERLLFEQMRKAIRVNLTNLADIPISLFTDSGQVVTGRVEDISESGVKARIPGYLLDQFPAGDLVADCELRLPDQSLVQGQVRVLGCLHDFQEDVSYLRCSFQSLSGNGDLRLKSLIADALARTSQDSGSALAG